MATKPTHRVTLSFEASDLGDAQSYADSLRRLAERTPAISNVVVTVTQVETKAAS